MVSQIWCYLFTKNRESLLQSALGHVEPSRENFPFKFIFKNILLALESSVKDTFL